MELGVFVAVGGMALVWSLAAILVPDELTQIILMFLTTVFWVFWAVSAGRVTVTTDCCVQAVSYGELGLLGGVVGLVFFVIGLYRLVEYVTGSPSEQAV